MSATAIVAAALLVVAMFPAGEASGATHSVTFRGDDGRTVNGVLTEAQAQPAPAVVLVPMLGGSRDEWQALSERLAAANITSLTIDLPGASLPDDPKVLTAWEGQVRAAVSYLAVQPLVRPGSIGVAGASLGANLAAVAAAADPRVRALVLLSPSLDYRGVRIEAALRQDGARPALLIASRKDPYAARSARELAGGAPGIRELMWSDTPAHGTLLLAREPDLVRLAAEWFQRMLGVN